MMSNIFKRIVLNDGNKIPVFGLGVYKSNTNENKEGCIRAVKTALNNGYRLIDTANFYGNESDVGKGISLSGCNREDVSIMTKLHWDSHGKTQTRTAFMESLQKLNTDYIDFYLIHSPSGGCIIETYDTLLELKKEGLIRSIGVSNFGITQLEGLRESGRPMPAVNQVEINCFMRREKLREYCKNHDIAVMGWAPLARNSQSEHPVIVKLAEKYNKSPAQVMLRWVIQIGVIPIPKSTNEQRIIENSLVFDWSISEEDMELLGNFPEKTCSSMLLDPADREWDSVK